ncbi:hypothetical protein CBM2592_B40109 [Cupriavidus taiwanensis]|nr:hypothetical protein CBM2592_B40109 [Cupriavidus taiwanensis]SOY70660.1 hypothetical protein CBM2588_B30109 [Cupriavidus taiwanensis]SOY95538.1 hypothetical protein CBM2591_B20109 [Cupriavidus taiwanensis]SOZ74328.1 hypothetical protein CBM2617_B60020 [Cupriavidus taiwanensis]SOZ88279.1 hypothetical protein CBM2618_B50023 [Cupriavidus taiwanensis]
MASNPLKDKDKQSLMSYIRLGRNGARSPYNEFTLFASTHGRHAKRFFSNAPYLRKLTWPSIKTTSRQWLL